MNVIAFHGRLTRMFHENHLLLRLYAKILVIKVGDDKSASHCHVLANINETIKQATLLDRDSAIYNVTKVSCSTVSIQKT